MLFALLTPKGPLIYNLTQLCGTLLKLGLFFQYSEITLLTPYISTDFCDFSLQLRILRRLYET